MYERKGVNAVGMCGVASHCRSYCWRISKHAKKCRSMQVHPRGCHLILEIIAESLCFMRCGVCLFYDGIYIHQVLIFYIQSNSSGITSA
jgi:hypothetical protein